MQYKFWPDDIMGFSVCIGIYVVSLAGHACLPAIYAQTEKPEKFEQILDLSFFAMYILYVMVAVFGYLTYGNQTQVIVTSNLIAGLFLFLFFFTLC